MEPALKQRLLGAAVLVALAVVFLPLLVTGPAPDSGASTVSLKVPPPPAEASGDLRTLDLPLAAPTASPGAPVVAQPTTSTAPADDPPSAASPAAAAGDYAVNFGSYATEADAARVIAALARARLPAWQQAVPLGTRTVHRVRVGPFTTAADAEAARLAAGRVRSDVDAKVVVLDAGNDAAPAAKPAATTAATPPSAQTAPVTASPAVATTALPETKTATAGTSRPTTTTAPKPATPPAATAPAAPPPTNATPPTNAAPAASNTGFAIQLGAFSKADEANRLRDRARAAGFPAFVEQVQTDHGTLSRVRVGPVVDRAAADSLRAQIRGKLGVDGIVRPHP